MAIVSQPIIRGIQSVGSVKVMYEYASESGDLVLPSSLMRLGDNTESTIHTKDGVACAGFRLDGEFLRANPQIDSSFMIPLLGGGALALTNNNRSGVLNLRLTRVSSPSSTGSTEERTVVVKDSKGKKITSYTQKLVSGEVGAMETGKNVGPTDTTTSYYDMTLLLQAQQAQTGGDSVGSIITIIFEFNGTVTTLSFQGCTVANIDPVGLSGNDAVDYNARINYLNWTVGYGQAQPAVVS